MNSMKSCSQHCGIAALYLTHTQSVAETAIFIYSSILLKLSLGINTS